MSFEQEVDSVLSSIRTMLLRKNASYGDSALSPIRVFSRASTDEQLRVRIDDKLKRLANGGEHGGEDTVADLIGYLVLLRIHATREAATERVDTDMLPSPVEDTWARHIATRGLCTLLGEK